MDQDFNQKKEPESIVRRDFLKKGALATAAFMIIPRHVMGRGFVAPSDRLLIASIGVGGKGRSDVASFDKSGLANVAYLCDVDTRRAADSVKAFPKAKFYKDWREMFDKEHKNFDAVSVSTPDHNHAIQAFSAMQLGKHVYVQKPMAHDIYEAHMMTQAAARYKVVTQMGNQGSSNDGTRILKEWYDADLIGDVHTVYAWTDRPVWPQGIPWSTVKTEIPKELDWDLWLGTAPNKNYVDKLVPFNWRGWWDYGTGALGDMGCHLMEAPFSVLNLKYAKDVQCSVGSVYVDEFKRGYFPESCPPSSHVMLTFPKTDKTKGDVQIHWMDGGIQPERPEELGANEIFGDGGNGTLFIGTKGKMICDTYSENPRLLPLSRNENLKITEKYPRVKDGASGHQKQWIEGCIAGYGKKELSSPFEIAGPLTEALLMANLAVRGYDLHKEVLGEDVYPGRSVKLLWDNDAKKVTNIDDVNQFVKRNYREGWKNLSF
ncbi:gfo/Idh/MocA family oxidoreductase [Flavobacterium aquariorum]|uniref:Gfo/Idh/MocA family oxidoreductase n=1 Tax=Flavobacterium aquariorum TaxID=2217670 RepID=A0A2W7UH47_9FLAO|nr:Gfo/Idh/MocA family oxidoreductase [Flavobacterium aquariorum]PZX92685.1 gfo/Idh/MocA family oxidoreductase [Flavobacterium aquariorum]